MFASREKIRSRSMFGVVFFAPLLALCACTTFKADLSPRLEPADIGARVPAAIGLYMSAETRAFAYTSEWRDVFDKPERYVFDLGQIAPPLYAEALSRVFESVETVSGPIPSGDPSVAGVIEIAFDAVEIAGRPFKGSANWAEISFTCALYSSDGVRVALWRITGSAENETETIAFTRPHKEITAAVERALAQAAQKLVRDFRSLPEIRNWLKKLP